MTQSGGSLQQGITQILFRQIRAGVVCQPRLERFCTVLANLPWGS